MPRNEILTREVFKQIKNKVFGDKFKNSMVEHWKEMDSTWKRIWNARDDKIIKRNFE